MNHHQRHTPPGANRALHYLSLLLLSAATVGRAMPAFPLSIHLKSKGVRVAATQRGYLLAVGSPDLRFQEPPLVAANPPALHSRASASAANATPAENYSTPIKTAGASTPPSPIPDHSSDPEVKSESTSTMKTKTSAPILNDDTRTNVHPEDFLPFFQFPSQAPQSGRLNVIVPVPSNASTSSNQPASSATYTQTPK